MAPLGAHAPAIRANENADRGYVSDNAVQPVELVADDESDHRCEAPAGLHSGNLKLADVTAVRRFLEGAGDSLRHFRYYSLRPCEIIERHVVTLVLETGCAPVAYGHLDPEGGHVWLGLCVAEAARRKRYGTRMLEALLQAAKARNIARVRLSVDSDNTTAIRLYESHGFIRVDDGDGKLFMDRAEDRK